MREGRDRSQFRCVPWAGHLGHSRDPRKTVSFRELPTQARSLEGEEVGAFCGCFPCYCFSLCKLLRLLVGEFFQQNHYEFSRDSLIAKGMMSVVGILAEHWQHLLKSEDLLGEQGINPLGRNWSVFRARDTRALGSLVGYVNKWHARIGDRGTLRGPESNSCY